MYITKLLHLLYPKVHSCVMSHETTSSQILPAGIQDDKIISGFWFKLTLNIYFAPNSIYNLKKICADIEDIGKTYFCKLHV